MATESSVKLTIGEEKVTTADVTKGQEIDMKARDPQHLHDDMKVCWLFFVNPFPTVQSDFDASATGDF